MRKNKIGFFVIILLVFSVIVAPAFAWQNSKKCSKSKGKLEAKFFKKAKSLIAHKDMIDLKSEQVNQIKKLCMETKKALIRNNAEIEILTIDIKSSLFDTDKINVKTVEKFIDQKYKFKKDKAKILVRAFAQVQGLLTKEQKDMVKDLKSEAKQKYSKGMKCCPKKAMGNGMKCGKSKAMGMCSKMKAPEAMSK